MIQATPTSSFGSFPACPTTRHQSQYRKIIPFNSVSSQKGQESTSLTLQGNKTCECFDLHKELVPYGDAWNWQKEMIRKKKGLIERNEECPDTLIVLQHQPVFTMGTGSSIEYLNFDIKDAPFEVYRAERGGEVTYHGPGQLVMYPIINLRNHKMDLHWYLRELEEVVIRVLSSTFSIKASRVEGLTGVWVGLQAFVSLGELNANRLFARCEIAESKRDSLNFVLFGLGGGVGWVFIFLLIVLFEILMAGDQKLAAIGIRVSRWIAYHGLALNVTTDLTPFNWIVPCGIRNRKVGSIKELLGEASLFNGHTNAKALHIDYSQLISITYQSLIREFCEVFNLKIQHRSASILESIEKKPES
ncbi:unnamed protein product [Dovyalis caffra]|uniref:lipoyl(octanoyl) transferase n=1 Tax=Dovyalis caffra TaxID=77055 RepID=A0AAV1S8B0_9ROSI|nr:unnamed protein product [Dovyalis caffra]